MSDRPQARKPRSIDTRRPIWERFFTVAPLVVVGTREEDGSPDLAPKHMAGPVSWQNFFGFVCSPTHATYANARREGGFTVSYPRPDDVVLAGLAASPRCEDGSKPAVGALPTHPGRKVDAPLLDHAVVGLECVVDRFVDDLGDNSLVIGRVVACHVDPRALRRLDREDQEVLRTLPLLVYLHPNRFARVEESHAFPVPSGFSR